MYFRNLARITGARHTAFTYHRTWETGLEEVTRVSSSSPLAVFAVTRGDSVRLASPSPILNQGH